MIKYADYDIVFQEIPNEVTLAINISNCPNNCVGCHSPHLMRDVGEILSEESLSRLLEKYGKDITCVCFMGGDSDPWGILSLCRFVKAKYAGMKTGWYSGKSKLPEGYPLDALDYVKIGAYKAEFGPLNVRTTNQHIYRVGEDGMLNDITFMFWRD